VAKPTFYCQQTATLKLCVVVVMNALNFGLVQDTATLERSSPILPISMIYFVLQPEAGLKYM